MNTSERPEVLRETDHVQERGDNPGDDSVLKEPRSNGQTPPRNPAGPHVPDEGALETFVGGAGI
jgi:hypothetical protein